MADAAAGPAHVAESASPTKVVKNELDPWATAQTLLAQKALEATQASSASGDHTQNLLLQTVLLGLAKPEAKPTDDPAADDAALPEGESKPVKAKKVKTELETLYTECTFAGKKLDGMISRFPIIS